MSLVHRPCPYPHCASSDAFTNVLYNPETGAIYRTDLKRTINGINQVGYVVLSHRNKRYLAHRVAFFIMEGRWPDQIDHINGVRSDNRWCNLREANSRQQSVNKVGWGFSGYKGVTWHKHKGKYHARVRFMDKVYHVGYFDDPALAKEAYDNKAKQLHAEFFNDKHRASKVSVP